jgi:prepilin-type N-terminal cleavage/methylation domain-containing protein
MKAMQPVVLEKRRGFTLLELLVVLGTLTILVGILLPSIYRARERERRALCTENLRKLGWAISRYGESNRYELPRVVYDERSMPYAYTAFTGADAANPFAPNSGVSPNDVTASLWLLIRSNYITSEYTPITSVFVCPSSGDEPDPIQDYDGRPTNLGRRSNFRSSKNLSYSYASPFSDAAGYGLKSDFLPKDFVLLADKNPGNTLPGHNAAGADVNDGPLQLAVANSSNHRQAGQNVLFGDLHVEFRETPYCGVGRDNIYTALARTPVVTGQPPDPAIRGVLGPNIGPAWQTDSYLVPAEGDPCPLFPSTAPSVPSVPVTAPSKPEPQATPPVPTQPAP